MVITGDVVVESASGRLTLRRNNWARVPACGATMRPLRSSAEVMRIAGCSAEIATVSLFQARPDKEVELHYHDGHEYWIFFRGRGRGCSEGVEYGLEPGAMIATAMGMSTRFLAPTRPSKRCHWRLDNTDPGVGVISTVRYTVCRSRPSNESPPRNSSAISAEFRVTVSPTPAH
jgi:mannose-6-phosphate isomerase-like protein (cupin superfamily)